MRLAEEVGRVLLEHRYRSVSPLCAGGSQFIVCFDDLARDRIVTAAVAQRGGRALVVGKVKTDSFFAGSCWR